MSDETPSLGDLTKLMLFFGRVPEVHLKNLKNFAFIYFNGHKESPKLDYSVATKKEDGDTVFSYDLTLNMELNDLMDKRYAALETAVRTLFWKEAKIKVSINGEEVYKSE